MEEQTGVRETIIHMKKRVDTCVDGNFSEGLIENPEEFYNHKAEEQSGLEVFKRQDGERLCIIFDRGVLSLYNDFLGVYWEESEAIGLIVGNYAYQGSVAIPKAFLPSIVGIFVKEGHRKEGIGSTLVESFLDAVERTRYIVDCEDHVKEFYKDIGDPIFLDEYKSLD